jgi:sec-independent protein translocase protein TatB
MGFQGIGIWEILLILIVALIVLGPSRLPGIARTLGKTVRAIKKASADLTANITRELEETKNEPSPSAPKEESNISNRQAPSTVSKADTLAQKDQPTNPEGHQQQND